MHIFGVKNITYMHIFCVKNYFSESSQMHFFSQNFSENCNVGRAKFDPDFLRIRVTVGDLQRVEPTGNVSPYQ